MKKQQKKPDFTFELGSDDMIFWRDIVEAKEIDVKNTAKNLRYYQFILDKAKEEYKKAEQEFKGNA